MHTMHPTLLIGPADWDSTRMPRAEFDARIGTLWRDFPDAAGVIVFGGSADHAALAYLTHFTPKLEPGIALIPRNGAPRLMVGGGANMLPAAKPLTWVADLVSLRPTGKTIADWTAASGNDTGRFVCVACDSMPTRMHREFMTALDGKTVTDGTAAVETQMQRKSERELACVREACATLQTAVAAMKGAHRKGAGVTDAVLAGEHAAVQRGAQDVRTMFSADGKTMRPFEVPVATKVDPLQVYIAVRQFGYWADGFVRLGMDKGAGTKVRETLQHFIATTKVGGPVAGPVVAVSIGLSRDEGLATTLQPGGVYGVRVHNAPGTVSAMVAVHEDRVELLWSAA